MEKHLDIPLKRHNTGYMYVDWTTLAPECNTGEVMADGSIDGCPRGKLGNLAAYHMFVRLSSQAEPLRKYVTSWDVNRVIVKVEDCHSVWQHAAMLFVLCIHLGA